MPYFRVQFMKDHVISNEGRSYSVLQRVVDIEARDTQEALQKAQQTFAVLEDICNWHVHADRIEVTGWEKPARKSPTLNR
jgi:hypothetical protein